MTLFHTYSSENGAAVCNEQGVFVLSTPRIQHRTTCAVCVLRSGGLTRDHEEGQGVGAPHAPFFENRKCSASEKIPFSCKHSPSSYLLLLSVCFPLKTHPARLPGVPSCNSTVRTISDVCVCALKPFQYKNILFSRPSWELAV